MEFVDQRPRVGGARRLVNGQLPLNTSDLLVGHVQSANHTTIQNISRNETTASRILAPFSKDREMAVWLFFFLAFTSEILVGTLSCRRFRRDWIRRLQLAVLSLEVKSLREKVVAAQGRRTPSARRLVRKRLSMAALVGCPTASPLSLGDALHALWPNDLHTVTAGQRPQSPHRQDH